MKKTDNMAGGTVTVTPSSVSNSIGSEVVRLVMAFYTEIY